MGKANQILLRMCYWLIGCKGPDKNGELCRTDRQLSQRPGISRFHLNVLGQAQVEQISLDFLAQDSRVQVERNVVLVEISLDTAAANSLHDFPVVIKVCRNANNPTNGPANGVDESDLKTGSDSYEEIIRAKYVIGCDGAHSWTRQQLGLKMFGEQGMHFPAQKGKSTNSSCKAITPGAFSISYH